MADGWYYNGIRIFVQTIRDDQEQIIAELNPVNNDTVYHLFGWTKPKYTVNAVVVGSSDVTALKGLLNQQTAYTLSGEFTDTNYTVTIDAYPRRMSFGWRRGIRQTLRDDLSSSAQVYDLEMELLSTT